MGGGQGRRGTGTDWEFRIDMYALLYLKQITNKDTLTAHRTLLSTLQ